MKVKVIIEVEQEINPEWYPEGYTPKFAAVIHVGCAILVI